MALSAIDLPWLPPAPADIAGRIREAARSEATSAADLQMLAGYPLAGGAAAAFGRALKRLRERGGDLSPLSGFRLGVLAAETFELIADALPAGCARHGVALDLVLAPYGQIMQEALDPASAMNAAHPDAVLIAADHRWLGLDRPALDDAEGRVEAAAGRMAAVVCGLREHGGAMAILQTLAAPPQALFGSYDRRASGSVRAMVEALNRRILELAEEWGALVFDAAALAERVGVDQWFDPVHWYAHKLPFAPACAPLYADGVGRLLGAVRGKARKCLVLDLDNTLWGGVIGDDGLEGIKLGHGGALGEAFLAVQHMAADLRARGVVLAVASKNDEAVAREPFRAHPDMALKENDIAVFRANWDGKPGNLRAIAATLNLGLDALVLLDDNPAERAQMRAELPMVAVPELPNDPAWYPWTVAAAGYFEAIGLSQEDRGRAAAYAADVERGRIAERSGGVGDYLVGLGMTLIVAPFDAAGRQRIAQLVNKTNQFNLTTRRYTEAEVQAFADGGAVFTLQARLADRFGDLGMIGVVICTTAELGREPAWEIDTWLMSCRVLGRKVEQGMLGAVAEAALAAGVRRLIGVYRRTPKNGMVAGHYGALGFAPLSSADGEDRFVLDLSAYRRPDLPF